MCERKLCGEMVLNAQVRVLSEQISSIYTMVNVKAKRFRAVEDENTRLRERIAELEQRLHAHKVREGIA